MRSAPPGKGFFSPHSSSVVATWTVADQRRLHSIDALHTRVLEYHNNVHVRSVEEVMEQYSMEMSTQPQPSGPPFSQKGIYGGYTSGGLPPSLSVSAVGGVVCNATVTSGEQLVGASKTEFLSGGGGSLVDEPPLADAPSTQLRGMVMSTRLAAALLSGSDVVAHIMLVQPQNTLASPEVGKWVNDLGDNNGEAGVTFSAAAAASSSSNATSSFSASQQVRGSQFSASSPMHYATPTPLCRERLGPALSLLPASVSGGGRGRTKLAYHCNNSELPLLWIHISDPSILEEIGNRYGLHELVISGFSDLRAYSSFMPTPTGLFVSFCSFVMIGTDVYMNKCYLFMGDRLVITHEREIHPDVSSSGELGGSVLAGRELIFPRIVDKVEREKSIMERLQRHGQVYLLYLYTQQVLNMQDSIIDFFSRTLYYFKQVVHTRLHHREKLKIHRKMHIVAVSIGMLQKSVELNIETFNSLLRACSGLTLIAATPPVAVNLGATDNTATAGNTTLISSMLQGIVTERHLPYLLDLCDAFKFANHCLTSEFEETLALDKAMDSITSLRNINTNTLLSLVATIFLPLNFLTGVFGTNFQTEQGYTMTLLSDPNGPYFFAAICLGSIAVIVSYFVYNGWVELRINFRRICSRCLLANASLVKLGPRAHLRQSLRGKRDSTDLYDSDEEEEEQEVWAEDAKRKRESLQRRSAASAPAIVQDLGRLSAGGGGS